MIFRKKNKKPNIVVAARDAQVLEALFQQDVLIEEVNSTRGLVNAIEKNPAMIVVDINQLIATKDVSIETVRIALETANLNGMPILDPSQFKESGLDSTTITRAQTNSGVRYVVPKTIAFTNYAGGVGKTTLSLSVSKAFRKVTGLGVAIIEAGVGASSIGPRIGSPDIPSLYQTIAIDGEPAKWQNVSLYPLSMRESQAIIGDQRAEEYIRKIRRDNTLTIFDASPLSPLWPTIVEIADEIIVLTTPRMDTVAQAETTYAEAVQMIMGMNLNKKPKMVMNMATSLTDRISMWSQLAATIPMNENAAANYSEELAAPILEVLYPGLGKATKKLPKEHKKSKENAEE